MQTFSLRIERKHAHSQSIIGEMFVDDRFLCYTLELPWLWNQTNVSCIPPGQYSGFIRYDKSDKWRIQLENVDGRSGIQIHVGNYPRHIKGCTLVGMSFAANAVYNSKKAYGLLKEAFYGSSEPSLTPNKKIVVEYRGILATPWGDFETPKDFGTIA